MTALALEEIPFGILVESQSANLKELAEIIQPVHDYSKFSFNWKVQSLSNEGWMPSSYHDIIGPCLPQRGGYIWPYIEVMP